MPLNAKDSIADLQKLYQESKVNEDKFHTVPPSSTSRSQDTHEGEGDDTENDDFLFLDDEQEQEIIEEKDGNGQNGATEAQHDLTMKAELAMATGNDSNSVPSDQVKQNPEVEKNNTKKTFSSSSSKTGTNEAATASYYSGFDFTNYQSGYDYDYQSYVDPYAAGSGILLSSSSSSEKKNIFCCLFPNYQKNASDSDEGDEDKENDEMTTSNHLDIDSDESIDESRHHLYDEDLSFTSSSSHEPGEGKEGANNSASSNKKTTTANDETNEDPKSSSSKKVKKPLKGILKHTVTKPDLGLQTKSNSLQDNKNQGPGKRRSILPTYSVKSFDENDIDDKSQSTSSQVKHRVQFSPMARVINVTARSEMSFFTRSLIWWQRNDYDDFKKTGRIISKAMLCGGSEIWLQTSNAWGKQYGKGKLNGETNGSKKDGASDETNQEEKDEDVGSKWWCKFGHSRRGLEHIVSIEEGKQRQRFVNTSIRAVLEEQRRQRMSTKDPKKLASVSLQYTSWARDLALAAGAADAEAVETNFNSGAKCRIHHLKTSLSGVVQSPAERLQNQHLPTATFVVLANSALTARVLDANIHIRRRKLLSQQREEGKHTSSANQIAKKAAGFQFQKDPNETKVPV